MSVSAHRSPRAGYHYYLLMAIAGLIGLIKSYAFAFVLGAEDFGYYNLTVIICNYLIMLCSFGLIEGLTVKLPWYHGEGRTEAIRSYIANTFVRYLLVGVLTTIGLTLIGKFVAGTLQIKPEVLLLGGLLAIHSGLLTLMVTDALSAGHIVGFGKISVLRNASTLCFGLVGAYFFQYEGAVVGELLAIFTMIVGILYRHEYIFHSRAFYHPGVKLGFLYREGMPVLRHNLLILFQQSLDKWLVLFFLGVSALGQYSFAMIIMAGFLLVHVSVGRHVGPRMIRKTAQGVPLRESLIWLLKVIGLILAVSLPLGVVIVVGAKWLLVPSFPEYGEGASIIPVVTLASIVQVTYLFDWFLFAGNKSRQLSYITFFMTVVYIAIGVYGAGNGFELMDYALLMLLMRSLLWIATFALAARISWGNVVAVGTEQR